MGSWSKRYVSVDSIFNKEFSYLSVLSEYTWSNLRVLLDKLVNWVGGNFRTGIGKVHESLETRIRLPQNGVTVTWNNTSRLENAPEEVVDILLGELLTNSLLHIKDESENLLGSKTVERTGETLKTSTVAKERIAESRSDQVGSVCRNVTTLVVTVESKVEAEEILEALILLA